MVSFWGFFFVCFLLFLSTSRASRSQRYNLEFRLKSYGICQICQFSWEQLERKKIVRFFFFLRKGFMKGGRGMYITSGMSGRDLTGTLTVILDVFLETEDCEEKRRSVDETL